MHLGAQAVSCPERLGLKSNELSSAGHGGSVVLKLRDSRFASGSISFEIEFLAECLRYKALIKTVGPGPLLRTHREAQSGILRTRAANGLGIS